MPDPHRLLSIVHVDAERGFSGGEVQVFLLLEGLRRLGHRNLLVCPPESRAEEQARERGLAVRAVPMRSDADLPAVWRLRRLLRESAPDLLHLHTGRATWLGALAARGLGIPVLTTRRMDRTVKRNARNRWLYRTGVRRVVAISPAVAEALLEGGVEPGRIRTIPSAVDPAALRPRRTRDALRAEQGLGPGEPLLLALAALVRRKGLDVLLDALARLAAAGPPPRLWIAGEGPERAALERQAARAGLGERVRFLGRREDAADLLAACDVFVMPSRREGLGVAALEAMAAGRPVVASRVGGLAAAVQEGGTGLLVPPEDPAALASALSTLLGDATLRARLGAAGPARVVAAFGAEAMVEAYEKLYREILAEVGRA
jgi:glycosyltransferase involved in cell wall biosynthesis